MPLKKPANLTRWEYAFPSPELNLSFNPAVMAPRLSSRLVGVDGRYAGRLRRFPGFKEYVTIPTTQPGFFHPTNGLVLTITSIGNSVGVTWMDTFGLKDTSSAGTTIFRGFVFPCAVSWSGGGSGQFYATYHYYSAAWQLRVLEITSAAPIYFSSGHDKLYANTSQASAIASGTAWRYDRENDGDPDVGKWIAVDLSPTVVPTIPSPTTEQLTTHKLSIGDDVAVAYRVVDEATGFFSKLSPVAAITAPSSGDPYRVVATLAPFGPFPTTASGNATIEFYRTTQGGNPDANTYGRLYLERVATWTNVRTVAHEAHWGSVTTGLTDTSLTLQDVLATTATKILDAPPTGHLLEYEDVLFRVGAGSGKTEQTGKHRAALRWSIVDEYAYDLVPWDNRRIPLDLSDSVRANVLVGPFAASIYDSEIIRIHRSGLKLAFDSLHNRYGSVATQGIVSVGSNLFMVSRVGILVCDFTSGKIDVLAASQHLFDETDRWRSTADTVRAGHDGSLGLLVFHNPSKEETLLLWMNENTITMLEDAPFDAVATGVKPAELGEQRAFFLEASNRIIYLIDDDNSAQTSTMNGSVLNVPLNGVAVEGSTLDTLKVDFTSSDSDYGFKASAIGFYLYFLSGSNKGLKRKVTAVPTGKSLSWDANDPLPTAPAVGDRYSLASIPFRWTGWPLLGGPQQDQLDMFRVDKVVSGLAYVQSMTGDILSTNPNLKLTYELYGPNDPDGTPRMTGEGTMALVPSETPASLRANGNLLRPGLEVLSSNVQFDLLGLFFDGVRGSSVFSSGTGGT